MKMVELYKQRPKTEKIKTVKGEINYLDWLKQERDRINLDPTRTAEVRGSESGNRASLWVDITDNYYVRVRT